MRSHVAPARDVLPGVDKFLASLRRRLSFVYDDLPASQHDFGIQHRIDVLEWIALKQDDVGRFFGCVIGVA